jgi:hypothetical protein
METDAPINQIFSFILVVLYMPVTAQINHIKHCIYLIEIKQQLLQNHEC